MKKHKIKTLFMCLATMLTAVVNFSLFNKSETNALNAQGNINDFSIAINQYDENDNLTISFPKYEHLDANNCTDELNFIVNVTKAVDPNYYDRVKCVIDLHGDCNIKGIDTLSFKIGIVINLNGYNLTLKYQDSWDIYGGITINGPGNINVVPVRELDYSPLSLGVFWVRDGDVKVKDITVDGFEGDTYPVFNIVALDGETTPRSASFENCIFKNCSGYYGGAISMSSLKKLSIIDCLFEECSARFGGALCVHSYCKEGYRAGLDIKTSTFKKCSASRGGALYFRCYQSPSFTPYYHSIIGAKFENCSASENGGAIVFKGDNNNITFASKASNCTAENKGGALYLEGSHNTLCELEAVACSASVGGGVYETGFNNMFDSLEIHDCRASDKGGAYFSYNPDSLTLAGCEFYGNIPSNGFGTLLSSGSVVILVSILAGMFLLASIVFISLYLKERRKSLAKKA